MAEKGDRSPINSHLEAPPNNPFGEAYPSSLTNNTSSSSSSQNPFLLVNGATNTNHVGAYESEKVHENLHSVPVMNQEKGGMTDNSTGFPDDGLLDPHLHSLPVMNQEKSGMTNNSVTGFPDDGLLGPDSSLKTSTNESSQGSPFEVPTSSTVGESHHTTPERGHLSTPSSEERIHPSETHGETDDHFSSQQLDPLLTLESAQNQQQVDDSSKNRTAATTISTSAEPHAFSIQKQGNHSNSGTDIRSGSSSISDYESSTKDDIQNSVYSDDKTPQKGIKFALETNDDDNPISSFPKHEQQPSDGAPASSKGSEKQYPPLPVMERPENPTSSSNYTFPSHVFDRPKSKSNTQWSTASNESLFSIHLGNMSFSTDTGWMSNAREMEKLGDMNSTGAALQGNLPPLPPHPQPPATKLNNGNQSTGKQHEGSKVTEEKAAETMREVIMENSVNIREGDLMSPTGARSSNQPHNLYSHSHHSDASTKSFAFNLSEADKTLTPKLHQEEKKRQQKPTEQSLRETPNTVQIHQQSRNATQQSRNANQQIRNAPNKKKKLWLSCFPCLIRRH